MFSHEAECMIRRRDGIGDVVVRHVDMEGERPWSRSQRLYPSAPIERWAYTERLSLRPGCSSIKIYTVLEQHPENFVLL